MSKPKRYRPVSVSKDRVEMHQCVSGEWTSLTEFYTLHDRLAALAAENERLRKEVDAMKHWIVWKGYDFPCVNDWSTAAKEGRDAK